MIDRAVPSAISRWFGIGIRNPSKENTLVAAGVAQRHELERRVDGGVTELSEEVASLHERKCKG